MYHHNLGNPGIDSGYHNPQGQDNLLNPNENIYNDNSFDDIPPPPPPEEDEIIENQPFPESTVETEAENDDELYEAYNLIKSDDEDAVGSDEEPQESVIVKETESLQQCSFGLFPLDITEEHCSLFADGEEDGSNLTSSTEAFDIYFVASPTVKLKLSCEPGTSVLEFLADSMLELLDLVEQDGFMTSDIICANKDVIENISIMSEAHYIKKCLSKNIVPHIALKPLEDYASDVEVEVPQEIDMMTTFGNAKVPQDMTSSHISSSCGGDSSETTPIDVTSTFGNNTLGGSSTPINIGTPSNTPSVSFGLGTFGNGTYGSLTNSYGTPKSRSTLDKTRGQTIESEKVDKRKTMYLGVKSELVVPLSENQITVLIQAPEDISFTLTAFKNQSIKSLKDTIVDHVRDSMGLDLGSSEKYLLKFPGASFLNNESEEIIFLPYVNNCIMRGSNPIFIILDKSSETAKRIKKNNLEIGSLIGRPLSWVQQDDEITSFRQSMARLRYFSRQERNKVQQTEMTAFPCRFSQPIQPNNKTLVQLRLDLLQVKKTVIAFPQDTAQSFIDTYYTKYYAKIAENKPFILKVVGIEEYVYGSVPFHAFDYVKECISKGKPIELALVERPVAESAEHDDELLEDESFLLEDPTIRYDHKEISMANKGIHDMACISVWDIHRKFTFKVIGVENISPFSTSFSSISGGVNSCDDCNLYMYVLAELYLGGELLDTPWISSFIGSCSNPRWCETASFNIKISDIPRAMRICFTVYASKRKKRTDNDVPLGWVNFLIFDYKHNMRVGPQALNMWPDDKANPIGTCVQNDLKNPPTLYISMDEYQLPVVFPTETIPVPSYTSPSTVVDTEQRQLEKIWNSDPLYRMSTKDKQLVWKYKEFCKNVPKALPKFLVSVPKTNRYTIQEMYRLLDIWSPLNPIDALELLDSKFADAKVRAYAVSRLEELSNDEILDYLLQLVQALKHEPYHDTEFARFLLRKALSSKVIGHQLFWYLKSEIHVQEISERFGLLLEAYLRGCGNHRMNLARQCGLQQRLLTIANSIKTCRDSERLPLLRRELSQFTLPPEGVSIPLDPRILVNGFYAEKCKYMDSKKLPLWLVMKNSDPTGHSPFVIFKAGDDLRQDMLTLQLIRIMDHLWKHENLDLKVIPYGCISTGNEVGMIEVVLNASTTAAITKKATAAFQKDPIANWMRDNNPHDVEYRKAVENFIYSCAGYCVATYVLGVGDRHNDNIMITKDGRLFHIDFGHFLGNYKKKFGLKRERAPFVFTPDFAYVMGGKDSEDFEQFLNLCCRAYNILRKHASLFINLFAMMLSTGIPELQTSEDIEYLRDAFSLDFNEQQAAEKFKQLVYESLSTWTTQINNAIHILVRG